MEEKISVVILRSDNTQYNSWKDGTTDNKNRHNDKTSQWFCGPEQHMLVGTSHFSNADHSHLIFNKVMDIL